MLFEGKELSKVVAVSYKEEFVCKKNKKTPRKVTTGRQTRNNPFKF